MEEALAQEKAARKTAEEALECEVRRGDELQEQLDDALEFTTTLKEEHESDLNELSTYTTDIERQLAELTESNASLEEKFVDAQLDHANAMRECDELADELELVRSRYEQEMCDQTAQLAQFERAHALLAGRCEQLQAYKAACLDQINKLQTAVAASERELAEMRQARVEQQLAAERELVELRQAHVEEQQQPPDVEPGHVDLPQYDDGGGFNDDGDEEEVAVDQHDGGVHAVAAPLRVRPPPPCSDDRAIKISPPV
jgi:hypothetical protein